MLQSSTLWTLQTKPLIKKLCDMEGTTGTLQHSNYNLLLPKLLRLAVEFLLQLDKEKHFIFAVNDTVAPGYSKIIRHPMAIETIRSKIDTHVYKSLDDLHDDVLLIVKNCLTYNPIDSPFSKVSIPFHLTSFIITYRINVIHRQQYD